MESKIVPLNIVQIIPAMQAGGAERSVIDITRAVVQAGGRALTLTQGGQLESEIIAVGGEVVHLPMASKNPSTLWLNAKRIVNIANNFGASLVHARSRAPAWSAKAACTRLGLPFVTTYHGTYSANSALKRRYNKIMAQGDRVIANSHFIARHILDEHQIDEKCITVIARGVDPAFFAVPAQNKVERAARMAKLGLPPNDDGAPLIVLPARFTRLKGHIVAIRALAKLRKKGRKAHLVFAGGTKGHENHVDNLRAEITTANLNDFVHFSGHIDDMPALYTIADIVLCASTLPESFGRTMVEGQASGRLCVGPNHGGSAETITDGKTGFHFIPGNADGLALTLQNALDLAPEQRSKICTSGRKQARALYSRDIMCAKTLGVYRDLTSLNKD